MSCGCEKIIEGAIGLTKVAVQTVGIPWDKAEKYVVKFRRDCCIACPLASRSDKPIHAKRKGYNPLSQCAKCECFIEPKIRVQSERCPLGAW